MEISLFTILFLLGIGIISGIAAGFIGIGGGVIMVPVLLELFRFWEIPSEVVVQAAMGTSLAVGTLSVTSSAIRHHKQGNVLWKVIPFIVPMSMVGGWVASVTAKGFDGKALQISLGVILLLAAIKMLAEREIPDRPMRRVPFWGWLLVGLGVGLFSGYSGLAGGLVLVPALAYIAHIETKKLAGTSSGVVAFTALAAAIGYMTSQPNVELGSEFFGHVNYIVAGCLAVTSIPGAQLGAYLNKKAGSKLYKRIFGVVLIFVVIRLLFTA